MSSKTEITKENLDTYLKDLGKEFRKLNGKSIPAEIIMIGGAAILVNYGFRDMTTDVDAIIHASSAMKEAINRVRDKYNLPNGWLNADFMRTDSYTSKLDLYCKHYRTFSNVLTVRTVSAEYLVAMKLKAGRQYKHDRSDILGILAEHKKRGEEISIDAVKTAVTNLYVSWDSLSEEMQQFIEIAFNDGNYDRLYEKVRAEEAQSKDILIEFQNDYPGVTNTDNVNDILAAMKQKRSLKEQIENVQSRVVESTVNTKVKSKEKEYGE